MHSESFAIMEYLVHTCLSPEASIRVLDVGSCDVNGVYESLFTKPGWQYEGADIVPGPNVDIVLYDPYRWEIPDASYDLIISGQVFEHAEFFWLTWLEMVRTVRPGGLIFLVVPSTGREHRHPVDCWRFYRDGMHALARYGQVEVLAAETYWGNLWGDTVGVFRKPVLAGFAGRQLYAPNNVALPHASIPSQTRQKIRWTNFWHRVRRNLRR